MKLRPNSEVARGSYIPPQNAVPPPAPAAKAAPTSLRDCLAPLAAGALETSLLVHKWGTTHGSLMRASTVMEMCADVVKHCNELLRHDERALAVPPAGVEVRA